MRPTLAKAQQLTQTRQTTPMLQKLMLAQLLGRRARLDVHAQAHAQETLELLAQLLRLLEARRAVRRNEVERLERLLVEVRRLRLDHFNRHDAQGPDVHFVAVLLLLYDFRCHPVRCADHGGALVALLRELGAEAEIGDFDGAARGEEHVVGFDVAVDYILAV